MGVAPSYSIIQRESGLPKITMKSQGVDEFCADMERLASEFGRDLREPLRECADIIHTDIGTNFREAISPDGESWPPRKDEGFTHPLLDLSGSLKAAATGEGTGAVTRIEDTTLAIGVDASVEEGGLPGAFVHQFGATIYPVKAKKLSWLNSAGERVFADSVTIPPRPYLGFSTTASDLCVEEIGAHLEGTLA